MIKLLQWIARWPLGILHALGALMGWVAYWGSTSYRLRFTTQARLAGLNAVQQRHAVAESGRMAAELPWLWLAPSNDRIGHWVTWDGAERVQQALDRGAGLVLLTPHVGSFEICAQAYALAFGARAPLTAMYRPARQDWLREVQKRSRQRPGLLTAPANLSGVRQMIRALRRNETVGLLPDQVPPDGQGVWVPFWGEPAYTMTLATRLLEQTGAQCLLMWCERLPGARGWVLHVRWPWELDGQGPDAQRSPAPDPAQINRLMETVIRQVPHQYLWGYHRFKAPKGGAGHSAEAST